MHLNGRAAGHQDIHFDGRASSHQIYDIYVDGHATGHRDITLDGQAASHQEINLHGVMIVFKALATTLTVSLPIEPYQVRLKIPVKTDDCCLPADDDSIADAINQAGPSHVTTST
jgi:hypothetical protein